MNVFLTGIKVGLAVAIPIGPIATLLIQRSFTDKTLNRINKVFAVSVGDFIYAFLGGMGMAYIAQYLHEHKLLELLINFILAALLIYIGIQSFNSRNFKPKELDKKTNWLTEFFIILFLTIANPITIGVFSAGIISEFGTKALSVLESIYFACGAFSGSMIWFFGLTQIISFIGKKINEKAYILINQVSGIFLMYMAAKIIYQSLINF